MLALLYNFTSVYTNIHLVGGTSRRRVSRYKREYLYIQVTYQLHPCMGLVEIIEHLRSKERRQSHDTSQINVHEFM